MRVQNIEVELLHDRCRLSADVGFDTHWVWGDEPFHLWYDYPHEYAKYLSRDNGDPFVAALLSSAMFLNEPLVISESAAISHQLNAAIPQIQEIYHCWDSKHSFIAVEADVRPRVSGGRASGPDALFYSLGVDSNYCLSKCISRSSHTSPLPELVMVEGFDVYLWERQRFPPMLAAAQGLAEKLGTKVLRVTTNLREFSDRVTDWVQYFRGAALASTVLALGRRYSYVSIAASQTYRHLIPRGAHPLLDSLWSTESTTFRHDGLEASRLDKIRAIAQMPLLLKNLRVCATSELTDAYNCGRCEKCLRTMIGLRIAGALEMCDALPHRIDVEAIRTIELKNEVAVSSLEELLEHLGDSTCDTQLSAALRERIASFHREVDGAAFVD